MPAYAGVKRAILDCVGSDVHSMGLMMLTLRFGVASVMKAAQGSSTVAMIIAAEGGVTQVIAKIEKPEALEQLEEIVRVSDGIMVARGDLGVEIDIAQMAVTQKRIARVCNKHRKMVICASSEGETARTLSKNRNFVPTVGVSNSEVTLRRMCLYWGVIPLRGVPTDGAAKLLDHVIARAQDISYVEHGDRVVVITGTRLIERGQNAIMVHEVE